MMMIGSYVFASVVFLTMGFAQVVLQQDLGRPDGCSGIEVRQGDDLVEIVREAPIGATICIAEGVHEIGNESIVPKPHMTLAGVPAVLGQDGSVTAASRIHGSGEAIIRFEDRAPGVTIRNLDISGAHGLKTEASETKSYGRGIDGGSGNAIRLLIERSRIHHNLSLAIGGAGTDLTLSLVELDHNGSQSYVSCCSGGVKSVNPMQVSDSYIHDNTGAGVWQDVCGTDLVVERNRIYRNSRWGVRYEHSSDCDGRATIVRNRIIGNNHTDETSDSGGIIINSAPNAEIAFNSLSDNGSLAISLHGNRGSVAGAYVHHNVIRDGELSGCSTEGVRCEVNMVVRIPWFL